MDGTSVWFLGVDDKAVGVVKKKPHLPCAVSVLLLSLRLLLYPRLLLFPGPLLFPMLLLFPRLLLFPGLLLFAGL